MDHHLAKFGDHRHCCSRDIADLMFHVTLQDHVIKLLCDFIERNTSLYITSLPNLVAIGKFSDGMRKVALQISRNHIL